MPSFLELSPGLVIWTLVNFSIFAFIIAKFGWKPMRDGLAARENAITDAIKTAEATNAQAQAILQESKEKIANAQAEMMDIVREGKTQAEAMIRKAADEADVVKKQKIDSLSVTWSRSSVSATQLSPSCAPKCRPWWWTLRPRCWVAR